MDNTGITKEKVQEILDQRYEEYVKALLPEGTEESALSAYSKYQAVTHIIISEFDDMFTTEGEFKDGLSDDQLKWILWHIPGGFALEKLKSNSTVDIEEGVDDDNDDDNDNDNGNDNDNDNDDDI